MDIHFGFKRQHVTLPIHRHWRWTEATPIRDVEDPVDELRKVVSRRLGREYERGASAERGHRIDFEHVRGSAVDTDIDAREVLATAGPKSGKHNVAQFRRQFLLNDRRADLSRLSDRSVGLVFPCEHANCAIPKVVLDERKPLGFVVTKKRDTDLSSV